MACDILSQINHACICDTTIERELPRGIEGLMDERVESERLEGVSMGYLICGVLASKGSCVMYNSARHNKYI